MRYLDTTQRVKEQSLGHWLSLEVPSDITHIRFKTGYFTANGLGALRSAISYLTAADLPVSAVLGTNENATVKSDVDALLGLIGSPRTNANLGIVACSGGLFHPKVIHLTRADGSQFAYVGSANLTPAGVNGTNFEAGILFDDRHGDPKGLLIEIASSIDEWLIAGTSGVYLPKTLADTQNLVDLGILSLTSPAKTSGGSGTSSKTAISQIALKPLIAFPPVKASPTGSSAAAAAVTAAAPKSPPATPSKPNSAATSSAAASQPPAQQTPNTSALQPILIAQIGGGPRWKQANFPKAIVSNFFGVSPTSNQIIKLFPVEANGTQKPPIDTQVVNVRSQNYRIELTTVSGIPYPVNGRPIGVFRRIGPLQFRYRIFLPGDPGYGQLDAALKTNYSGPSHHLSRVELSGQNLSAIWPNCPV